ncbi:hypothetical protein G5714_019165 [Onychostoma macrolepis]|uniref:Uncharacterized protein n=1 Tax=Onychostoma macrolepis TaxID=369639 RepID=A0A7J6C130_9TELE|nr:hypothetical protein G5714_019165 [Onychostoma macrolepis]
MLKSKKTDHNTVKEVDTFIEYSSRGRSTTAFAAVPSFDSRSTVGQHTDVLGAPAPGITAGPAAMKSELDDVVRLKEVPQDAKKLDEPWIRRNENGTIGVIDLSSKRLTPSGAQGRKNKRRRGRNKR